MAQFVPTQQPNRPSPSRGAEVRSNGPARPRFVPRQDPSSLERASRVGQAFTTGAADMLGLPADLVNLGLEAVGLGEFKQMGGSGDIRALGQRLGLTLGPGEDTGSFSERVAREVGAAALPTGAFLGAGGRVLSTTQGMLAGAARSAAARPGTTVALETLSATGAATGGELANQVIPDNDTAEIIGELAGGFTPSILTSIPSVAQLTVRGGRALMFPWTEAGGRVRAARRLQTASPDPEQAAKDVDRLADSGLPPARRTGQPQLLEIENAVRRFDPEADWRISSQLTDAEQRLRNEARSFSGASPQRVRDLLENRRDYLLNTLDVRAAQAGEEFTIRLANLEGERTPRQISRIARETVEGAYREARADEKRLWGAIKQDVPVELSNSRQTLDNILSSRSEAADPDDIPSYVSGLLSREGRPTVKFAQDLRSRVLQDIRSERAKDAPNSNKIRILNEIQESILEDMGSAAGQREDINTALQFSRRLNQQFTQGKVGSLLGFERTGARRVAAEDTLSYIMRGGTATTNIQDLYNAAPETRNAVEDYLRNTFSVSVVGDNGRINRSRANRFFEKYGDILDLSPGLRDELSDTVRTGERVETFRNRRQRVVRALERPKKTAAALWLNAPIDQEIRAVLRSQNPAQTAAKLRQQVQSDPEALAGLRQAYVDELFSRSLQGSPDEEGVRFIQGGRFREMLNETRPAARAFGLDEADLNRLEAISTALARGSQSSGTAEYIVGDRPGRVMDWLASWIGAQTGGKMGSTSGSSIQQASRMAREMRETLGRITRDKATEILREAVENPTLFRDLLLTPTASPARQNRAAQRIHAYILGVQSGEDTEEEGQQR